MRFHEETQEAIKKILGEGECSEKKKEIQDSAEEQMKNLLQKEKETLP
jgi:hypothetical protein